MSKANWTAKACGIFLLWAAAAVALPAQTFKTLWTFGDFEPYGENPFNVSLVQGTDGNYYGTTFFGGENEFHGNDGGTVFKITPDGTPTTVYSFCAQDNCADGEGPFAGLVLGTDGNFYGTTRDGGATVGCTTTPINCGTVFKVTPGGVLATLHSFTGNFDGSAPLSALVQGTDGSFYGTTSTGGVGKRGTIFSVTPSGSLKTLHNFGIETAYNSNGTLLQASDGNVYGTTEFGGDPNDFGTVFKLTPAGQYTTLYTFCSLDACADGRYPLAGLIQGTDGDLYGTTEFGGASMNCAGGAECGTVFKITLQGALTTLFSFDESDGAYPDGPVIQATDGNFYGMTVAGGTGTCLYNNEVPGCGTIFEVTPDGILTTLYYFSQSQSYGYGGINGGGLLQATNGIFYGTTAFGGTYQGGTIFSESVGLGQFVESVPTSGKVGSNVTILGTFLTGTTSVTFNGTPATFTVNSKSEIKTTVPVGATTGTIQVVTPRSGTLSSDVPFTVQQ
jgi:uncharacterized repeat protein (TIGR03803 family)